jgi:hypothetical protein
MRQREAEWTCTEGQAEDGEVDLLLMMGRGDDLGEIREVWSVRSGARGKEAKPRKRLTGQEGSRG